MRDRNMASHLSLSRSRVWLRTSFEGCLTHMLLFTLLCVPAIAQLDLNRLDGDTVCPPMKNGQDDLPGFDLITQFQLDVIPMRGVRKVEGSTPLQVAYRLDREANFQIPTRLNFPRGFPDEYSFMTTFRMIKSTVNKVWNIWQVVDEDGLKQAGMRLNGDQQALEFFSHHYGRRPPDRHVSRPLRSLQHQMAQSDGWR